MFRDLKRCSSDERYLNTLAWLTSRHLVLATCRQFRDECFSSYLVSNALIEPQSFFRPPKRPSIRRRLDEEQRSVIGISAFPSSYKHWGMYPYIRLHLIDFLADIERSRLLSIRDLGISMIPEGSARGVKATVVPVFLEDVATQCAHLKTAVAKKFSIRSERFTISIGYRCVAPFTSLSYFWPWDLPEGWISDTVYISISIDREAVFHANLEKAIHTLQKKRGKENQ